MPALIIGAAVLTLMGLALARDSGWRNERMRRALQAAIARNDHAETQLMARRLLRQQPGDSHLQFELASAMAHGADREAAIDMMDRLARERRNERAALWLLNEQFAGAEWMDLDRQQRARLGALLGVAAAGQRAAGSRYAALYADYLIATGSADQALPYLEKLAVEQPERALQVASIYRAGGDERRAVSTAEQMLQRVEGLAVAKPAEAESYLTPARFLVFLGRYQQAVEVLTRGWDQTHDDRLRQAAAETLVVWARSTAQRNASAEQFALQLSLLQRAVELAPQNMTVLQYLVPLVLQAADEDDPRVTQLQQAIVRGVAPGIGHLVSGTAALVKGRYDEATFHLETAAEQMPQSPMVLNNLAVALAGREPAELDRALELVDAALELNPQNPRYHETRGQILLKMADYREAIVSLEQALRAPDLALEAHRGLAVAYAEIGINDYAREHEAMAAKVAAQQLEQKAP